MSEKTKEKGMTPIIESVAELGKAKELVPNIQDRVIDGTINPLKTMMFFKKMGKIADEMMKGDKGKEIQHLIEQEFILHNEKGSVALAFGNKVVNSNKSWFDFSGCGDTVWEELKKIESRVKELIKTREAELKLKIPNDKVSIGAEGELNIGGGVSQTNIGVSYHPKLILEPTDDLLIINPPKTGKKSSLAYWV